MEAELGSIDRVKLKTEVLRFTGGVTFISSVHLHAFKTKTEGHKEKGKS